MYYFRHHLSIINLKQYIGLLISWHFSYGQKLITKYRHSVKVCSYFVHRKSRTKKKKTKRKSEVKHIIICMLCTLHSILGLLSAILSLSIINWFTQVKLTWFGSTLCFTGFTSFLCMLNIYIFNKSLKSIAWLNYAICWLTILLLSNATLLIVIITYDAYSSSQYALLTPLACTNSLTVASCIGLTILYLQVKQSNVVVVAIVLHMLVGLIGLSLVVLSELCALDLLPRNCLSDLNLKIIVELLPK